MARDNQRSKVYQWEKAVFAGLWADKSLTPSEVCDLYSRILTDAGRNPSFVKLRFTKRKGGACASRSTANFTPTRMPMILVLHEAAHTLTRNNSDLRVNDPQGHGPNYVACYLALIERYMGLDIGPALNSLRFGFQVTEKVTRSTGRTVPVEIRRADGSITLLTRAEVEIVERKKTETPPKVSMTALNIWRTNLAGGPKI